MPHISVHDLPRVTEVARVLASHGFGELARIVGVDTATSQSDTPVAMRVRLALADLGPTFIKLGQVLSVRPDILPPHVIAELATLQDNAPQVEWPAARAVLEEELRVPPEELFASIDPVPVASASIAQVHFAVLKDGTEVAVKVQRPGIERTLRSDLHILYTLARALEGRAQVPGLYTPVEIVQEFEAALQTELDFLQEATAGERFRSLHKGVSGVAVPAVHRELCTRRVLVMERIVGRRLASVEGGSEEGRALMRKLIECWYFELFEFGFFHGDPHPGNLMVGERGELVFLDFGLTGQLSGEMQDVLTSVFTGLAFKDAESVALAIYRAGATAERVDLKAFRAEIERMMAKYEGATLSRLSERGSLTEFVEVASRYRIQLPREYAILARATSIVDGIARRLLPDADIVAEVRPFAQRLVSRRFGPERLGADAFRALQHAQVAFRDLPTQTNQLLLDLERGRVVVTTRDPDAEALRIEIRHASTRIVLALCSLGLGVSGALLLAPWQPHPFGVPALPFVGTATATAGAVVFVGLLLHVLLADRLKPAGLRRRLVAIGRFFVGGRDA